MAQNQTNPRIQTETKLLIDIATLIGFLITMEPRASGLGMNGWQPL